MRDGWHPPRRAVPCGVLQGRRAASAAWAGGVLSEAVGDRVHRPLRCLEMHIVMHACDTANLPSECLQLDCKALRQHCCRVVRQDNGRRYCWRPRGNRVKRDVTENADCHTGIECGLRASQRSTDLGGVAGSCLRPPRRACSAPTTPRESGGIIQKSRPGRPDVGKAIWKPGRPSAVRVVTRSATDSSDDRSKDRVLTLAPSTAARIRCAAASPLTWLRTGMMTSAPAPASRVAMTVPMPSLAPVTTARVPVRSRTGS
ncbi:hypothetical protein QFZ50_001534 [Arthrobacter agilis]|nr:hypothetical protein [Arthrobacter agilis]